MDVSVVEMQIYVIYLLSYYMGALDLMKVRFWTGLCLTPTSEELPWENMV